jgi:XTP/dITP diphosphohydrolase
VTSEGNRRWLAPGPLVIASHNAGKVREIGVLLEPYGIEPISAATLLLSEPDETEDSFIGNARLKALAAARASGMAALADDSGLCVDALAGAPGIYSARWAGPDKDFTLAMEQIERALVEAQADSTKRGAHFVCALSLAWPDGHSEEFEGKVFGALTFPPRGTQGFGYDPIFVPRGFDISFGEMEPDAKHAMSHRAKAFEQLVRCCFKR